MIKRISRRGFHALAIPAVLRAAPDREPALVPIPLLHNNEFADVFDPEVQQQIRAKCSSRAKNAATGLVAYTFTEIPPWNRAWVNWFRWRHGDSPGKQQYVQFLKETYNYSIGDVNKAYGIDSTSFTDLGQFNWNGARLNAPKPQKDDEEFLGWIAQALFNTAAEAIRKADPTNRIQGQQLEPDSPKSVVEVSKAIQETYNLP